jgi:HK97 gp10 family phage protein
MSFRLINNVPQVTAKLQREAKALVVRTAARIETTAKLSFVEPKTGREYRRGNKTHIASAPGESPAVDTGQLTNSVQWEQTADASAVVGSNVEHGLHTEFGTSRMEPRPWLGPAFEEAAESFEKGVKELLKRAHSVTPSSPT